jgi:hypothetical protein
MRRRYKRAICAAFAFATLACAGDPSKSLRSGPFLLSVAPTVAFLNPTKSVSIVVVVRDEQLNPVPLAIAATSANPATATVEVDTSRHFPDGATQGFLVTAVAPGQTTLTVTAGGLTGSIVVNVVPVTFGGALSSTTPRGGDTLTISSTAVLKFDPDSVTVTFGGDEAGILVFVDANSIKVLTPFSDAGAPTITGVLPTFIPGLHLTLPTSVSVVQTGDRWAGDGSWQTAPNITALLPASGKSSKMISTTGPANVAVCPELAFASSGPCMMFKFTLADTATYKFTTDWEGTATAPDVDIYVCSDSTVANFGTACFEDGGGGATSAKPQATANHKYTAGTHYFVIENYDGAPSKNYRTTISRP